MDTLELLYKKLVEQRGYDPVLFQNATTPQYPFYDSNAYGYIHDALSPVGKSVNDFSGNELNHMLNTLVKFNK